MRADGMAAIAVKSAIFKVDAALNVVLK